MRFSGSGSEQIGALLVDLRMILRRVRQLGRSKGDPGQRLALRSSSTLCLDFAVLDIPRSLA